jgi:hypothetical protein
MALSLGLTFSESIPDLAERQINFAPNCAGRDGISPRETLDAAQHATAKRADPCVPKVLHSAFGLE